MKYIVNSKVLFAVVFMLFSEIGFGHGTVNVVTHEWGIKLSKHSTGPGKITFVVSNKGKDEHEIEVVRLEDGRDVADFPRTANKSADDKWVEPRGMGEVEEIKPGMTKKLTLDLKPGRYALICNMVEKEADGSIEAHYDKGMRKLFVVKHPNPKK